MAITAWKTWASGDILTAVDVNTYVRDNGRWLSHHSTGGAPMCRVFHSTSYAHTSGNAIPYNSEDFDPFAMHDTVSNNSRLTVPSGGAGKYLVAASVRVDTTATPTNGAITGTIHVNGSTTIASENNADLDINVAVVFTPTALWNASAGDYFETVVTYSGVASVNVTRDGRRSPEMWAIWLGE